MFVRTGMDSIETKVNHETKFIKDHISKAPMNGCFTSYVVAIDCNCSKQRFKDSE